MAGFFWFWKPREEEENLHDIGSPTDVTHDVHVERRGSHFQAYNVPSEWNVFFDDTGRHTALRSPPAVPDHVPILTPPVVPRKIASAASTPDSDTTWAPLGPESRDSANLLSLPEHEVAGSPLTLQEPLMVDLLGGAVPPSPVFVSSPTDADTPPTPLKERRASTPAKKPSADLLLDDRNPPDLPAPHMRLDPLGKFIPGQPANEFADVGITRHSSWNVTSTRRLKPSKSDVSRSVDHLTIPKHAPFPGAPRSLSGDIDLNALFKEEARQAEKANKKQSRQDKEQARRSEKEDARRSEKEDARRSEMAKMEQARQEEARQEQARRAQKSRNARPQETSRETSESPGKCDAKKAVFGGLIVKDDDASLTLSTLGFGETMTVDLPQSFPSTSEQLRRSREDSDTWTITARPTLTDSTGAPREAEKRKKVTIAIDPKMECYEFGSLKFIKPVGRGGGGAVATARHHKLGIVAVKVLHRETQSSAQDFLEEATVFSSLRHRNTLLYMGVCVALNERQRVERLGLIAEYCPGGDLHSLIHHPLKGGHPPSVPMALKIEILWDILSGLQYLHAHDIVHRDLKPRNILLQKRILPVKLCDFGLAGAKLGGAAGRMSVGYASPEVLMGEEAQLPSDVYSFGLVAIELLTGKTPFEDPRTCRNENAFIRPRSLPDTLGCPRALLDLVTSCINNSPARRPVADEAGAVLELLAGGIT